MAALSWCAATAAIAGDGERSPLVPIATVDPTIIEDIRYATSANFTGRKVPGYEAPRCLLRPAVAKALARVQADLAEASPRLSLKVFDCYRPQRSVRSFMAWAASAEDGTTRHYYPEVARSALIPKGYIARASTHSRGIAVDLTVVARDARPADDAAGAKADRDGARSDGVTPENAASRPCTEPPAAADGALDMGTTFDCFAAKSHTGAGGLTPSQRQARQTLKSAMARHGFVNYAREWWHYTYPAADDGQSFDVPVR